MVGDRKLEASECYNKSLISEYFEIGHDFRSYSKVANTSTPLTEMDFHGIIDKADRIFSILSASRLSSQYSSTTLSTTFTFSSSGQVKKKKLYQ
ncbi:unnamed protein product [Rhizophagus irregularis]|nr:unnamed protein product [Rhizophagus irregularis]